MRILSVLVCLAAVAGGVAYGFMHRAPGLVETPSADGRLITLESADGRFRAALPAGPRRDYTKEMGLMLLTIHATEAPGRKFGIMYGDAPTLFDPTPEEARAVIDLYDGRSASRYFPAGSVQSTKVTLAGGHPGREIRADVRPGGAEKTRGRMYIVGKRIYVIAVAGGAELVESAEAGRFLDSLEVLPKRELGLLDWIPFGRGAGG